MLGIEALLNNAQNHRINTGRPLVTLSYAQSLDGCLAARRGKPMVLSGSDSLKLTHQLRAACDAILVGIGTVLADDPQLTVRLVEGSQPQPVVLDSRLRTPPDARLLSGPHKPWVVALKPLPTERQTALEQAGARLLSFDPDPEGRIPLRYLLEKLGEEGVNSLMVEGGAEVLASFLTQRLADQAVITIAPVFVGGLHLTMSETSHSPFPRLFDMNLEQMGEDLIVWGKIN